MSRSLAVAGIGPQGVASGAAALSPERAAKLWQSAKDFEGMALGELLAPMFETVDSAHGLFGGGDAEAAWKPMLVQAIGKQMAAESGLGLAQPVYAALLGAQTARDSAARGGNTR